MAVGYTPGSPEQVATDVVSGAHYQLVKLDVGGAGASSPLSTSNPLPIRSSGLTGTDRSITASTASQQLMAANAARSRFFVKNDTTIDVWINFGAVAAATPGSGNIKVPANGGYFEFAGGTAAINIIATSGTPAITAREF